MAQPDDVPYLTKDEILDKFSDDVSDDWRHLNGLRLEFENGQLAHLIFVESTNAGTRFSICYSDRVEENYYLGQLLRLLKGKKITVADAKRTSLSIVFDFKSQAERDQEKRAKRRKIRDEKRAKEKEQLALEVQQKKERAEKEIRAQELAVKMDAFRLESELKAEERKHELETRSGLVRKHFGNAIPTSLELGGYFVDPLTDAMNDPGQFIEATNNEREAVRTSYSYDRDEVDEQIWLGRAAARAILEVHQYQTKGKNLKTLASASSWWREAKCPKYSIQITDWELHGFSKDHVLVWTSRAAALCDIFGSRTDPEAMDGLDEAVRWDNCSLSENPNNPYALRQISRALTLRGRFLEGVEALSRASHKSSENSIRSEFETTLRILRQTNRQEEYLANIKRAIESSDLPTSLISSDIRREFNLYS